MKRFYLILSLVIMALSNIQCQPNTKTTIEIGIVNPQPEKTYIFFAEIKQDSTTSQLADGMDYLSPNVSSLIKTLTNIHTVADTTFGEIKINDQTHQQFIKAGLVQVDDSSLKYSAMKTTYWVELDMIEPMQAGFFIRKK